MKANKIKLPSVSEIARLVRAVREEISPEFRVDEESEIPGIQLTVGANASGAWNYQTGDNSFTGGAYSFRAWGVAGVYKDSNSFDVAREIIDQIADALQSEIDGERWCAEEREARTLKAAGLHSSQTGCRAAR